MARNGIQEAAQPRPGQPAKGGKRSTWRAPEDHHQVYEQAYRDAGFTSLSDYTAFIMARFHGLDTPDFVSLRIERGADEPMPELAGAGLPDGRRMRMAG